MTIIVSMETIFDSYVLHLISYEEAIELLQDNCSLDTEDAQHIVNAWDNNKSDQKWATQ